MTIPNRVKSVGKPKLNVIDGNRVIVGSEQDSE